MDEQYWRKRGSYVRPRDPAKREPGVRYRAVRVGNQSAYEEQPAETAGAGAGGVPPTPAKGGGLLGEAGMDGAEVATLSADYTHDAGQHHTNRPGEIKEPDWSRLAKRSTPGRPVHLMDGGVWWEREDAEVRMIEKYGLNQQELPRTSTMEMHYYHISEVWHALYNRAEERHLRDPENLEVKDEDVKRLAN